MGTTETEAASGEERTMRLPAATELSQPVGSPYLCNYQGIDVDHQLANEGIRRDLRFDSVLNLLWINSPIVAMNPNDEFPMSRRRRLSRRALLQLFNEHHPSIRHQERRGGGWLVSKHETQII